MGYEAKTRSWYWMDGNSISVHGAGAKDVLLWTRRTGITSTYPAFPGDDAGVAAAIPAIGVWDIASRPEVLTSCTTTPDGGLVLEAVFPLGSRGADPRFPLGVPGTWTYHLDADGRVSSLKTLQGGKTTDVHLEYAPTSPPGIWVRSTAYSDAVRIKEIWHSPTIPKDFLSLERLRPISIEMNHMNEERLAVASFEKTSPAPATPATPGASPTSRTYNPLAQYSLPALLAGVVLVAIGAWVWWKRSR